MSVAFNLPGNVSVLLPAALIDEIAEAAEHREYVALIQERKAHRAAQALAYWDSEIDWHRAFCVPCRRADCRKRRFLTRERAHAARAYRRELVRPRGGK